MSENNDGPQSKNQTVTILLIVIVLILGVIAAYLVVTNIGKKELRESETDLTTTTTEVAKGVKQPSGETSPSENVVTPTDEGVGEEVLNGEIDIGVVGEIEGTEETETVDHTSDIDNDLNALDALDLSGIEDDYNEGTVEDL